jgi:hypothetical protein
MQSASGKPTVVAGGTKDRDVQAGMSAGVRVKDGMFR